MAQLSGSDDDRIRGQEEEAQREYFERLSLAELARVVADSPLGSVKSYVAGAVAGSVFRQFLLRRSACDTNHVHDARACLTCDEFEQLFNLFADARGPDSVFAIDRLASFLTELGLLPQPGQSVTHERLGVGRVMAVLPICRIVVRFPGMKPQTLFAHRLRIVKQAPPALQSSSRALSSRADTRPTHKLRSSSRTD